MKLIFKLFFIVSILFLITNCKSKTNEPFLENIPEQLKRVWMLVEFQDFKKEDLIKNEAQLNLADLKNAYAKMGCNQIGFSIEFKKDKIKFLNPIKTRIFCENKMKLEDAFSKSLSETYSQTIKGHTLTLLNSKNEKMVFVAQDWD